MLNTRVMGCCMDLENRSIEVENGMAVSSVWAVPSAYDPDRGTALILAHGAGADMNHEFMVDFQSRLTEAGSLTIRFNFPYTEQGRRAPDRRPRLEATFRAVLKRFRDSSLNAARVFIGGKSMGGRIASYLAASGEDVSGLVFLGYPLHPPNRHQQLRTSHWEKIRCPALFIQGTRDALSSLDLLGAELKRFGGPTEVHVVEGGDHSFKTLKKLGRTPAQVRGEISEEIQRWLNAV